MLKSLHDQQQHCHALVSKLLDNVVQQLPVSTTVLYQPRNSDVGSASMLGAVNRMMWLPARAVSSLWRQASWGGASSPAADASLSLLLLLLHQAPSTSDLEASGFHVAFQVSYRVRRRPFTFSGSYGLRLLHSSVFCKL